jgi:hypothetical protein
VALGMAMACDLFRWDFGDEGVLRKADIRRVLSRIPTRDSNFCDYHFHNKYVIPNLDRLSHPK